VPTFSPFRGIRFDPHRAGTDLTKLTSPPYDVVDDEAHGVLLDADPHNPVRLILPESYERAADLFGAWRAEGVLATDPASALYPYRMSFSANGRPRTTTGVIGALELLPAAAGGALPHERTVPRTKSDRLELLRATRANLEPIWVLSLAGGLTALLGAPGSSVARATDGAGTVHELFVVADDDRIAGIAAAVASAPVMIADGHHRYETAVTYQEEQRAALADRPAAHDAIMALVVELAEDQVAVGPIHRVLRGAPPPAQLRRVLSEAFEVTPAGANGPDAVSSLGRVMESEDAMGLVDGEGLALLRPRPDVLGPRLSDHPEALGGVGTLVVEVGALAPLRRTAPDLDVAYRHDAGTVAQLVSEGDYDAAILLEPVPVSTIRAVAAAGERMPEKTTFFQPKPRTGFVFRSLAS
jgi:uncharacterized protein (DUF1015 family)